MPIYAYRASEQPGCDHCGNGFEKLQRMRDEPLRACPRCHGPVRLLISAPNIADSTLSDRNVGEHGFTRYERREKGVYEKTAGDGPDLVRDED